MIRVDGSRTGDAEYCRPCRNQKAGKGKSSKGRGCAGNMKMCGILRSEVMLHRVVAVKEMLFNNHCGIRRACGARSRRRGPTVAVEGWRLSDPTYKRPLRDGRDWRDGGSG